MTQLTGIITGAGAQSSVVINPASNENVCVFILSGDYTGFEGIFESSPDGVTWSTLNGGIRMDTYQQDSPIIQPSSGQAIAWGFNLVAANDRVRLRPIAYGAGEVDVIALSITLSGGIPVLVAPTPTPVDRSLQGAATALAPSMPAVVGKTNYVTHIVIDGTGATAGSVQAALLSGVTPQTLAFIFVVPAGANVPLGGGHIDYTFNPPIAGSAPNTAVTLTVPSFGTGNLRASASIQGFVQ